jgi:hypothetical protein
LRNIRGRRGVSGTFSMNMTEGRGTKRENIHVIIPLCSRSLSTYNTMTCQNPEDHSLKNSGYEDSKIHVQIPFSYE